MPRNNRKVINMSAALSLPIADQIAAANAEAEALNAVEIKVSNGFTIDDDIAIPEGRAARQSVYPFADLNVGQSFYVPSQGVPQAKLLARLVQACNNRNKKGQGQFIARKFTGNAGDLGVRVWRKA